MKTYRIAIIVFSSLTGSGIAWASIVLAKLQAVYLFLLFGTLLFPAFISACLATYLASNRVQIENASKRHVARVLEASKEAYRNDTQALSVIVYLEREINNV